MMLDNVNNNQV